MLDQRRTNGLDQGSDQAVSGWDDWDVCYGRARDDKDVSMVLAIGLVVLTFCIHSTRAFGWGPGLNT